MNDFLQGLKIIDLSHRLPGPVAGKMFSDGGAKVLKIEDQKFQDPFIKGFFAQMDNSFKAVYQELNQDKETLRLDFNDPSTKEVLAKEIKSADGIIMGLPLKVQKKLGINQEELEQFQTPLGVIELASSLSLSQSMHDLNCLAHCGLLALHLRDNTEDIVAPPFLPISGVSFGVKTAFDLLALIVKAQKEDRVLFGTTYLLESTQEIFGPFWPKALRNRMDQFLHNGRYPCYGLYRAKDGKYVALACVEEKFWNRFCELFKVDIPPAQRFNTQKNYFLKVSEQIKNKSSQEIAKLIQNEDICITLV